MTPLQKYAKIFSFRMFRLKGIRATLTHEFFMQHEIEEISRILKTVEARQRQWYTTVKLNELNKRVKDANTD